jgi:hypothetical protein
LALRRVVHPAGRPIALVAWRLLGPALKRQDAFAHQLDERARDRGVELAAGAAFHLLQRVGLQERLAIDPWAGHRVERVRDREDAALEWYFLARQLPGIAPAVVALVQVEDPLRISGTPRPLRIR